MRLSACLLAVACCAGLSLPAAEGQGGPKAGRPGKPGERMQNLKEKHPEIFARFDANKDGRLDADEERALHAEHAQRRAEVEKKVLEKRPEADQDGDGRLSRAEFKAAHECVRDGRIAEFKQRHPKLFQQADTDGDGTLSDAERQAARTALEKRLLEKHPEVDANGDGRVQREEFQAARERLLAERMAEFKEKHPQLFARFDADKDGQLDPQERKAAREALDRKIHECQEREGKDGKGKDHSDNGRRPGGQPDGNGHDRGRRGND